MVLLEGLALAAPTELGELVIGFVGDAKLERVLCDICDIFGPRRFLDGVEVLLEIGYRCVGLLARAVSAGRGRARRGSAARPLVLTSEDSCADGRRRDSPEDFGCSGMGYARAGRIEGGGRRA